MGYGGYNLTIYPKVSCPNCHVRPVLQSCDVFTLVIGDWSGCHIDHRWSRLAGVPGATECQLGWSSRHRSQRRVTLNSSSPPPAPIHLHLLLLHWHLHLLQYLLLHRHHLHLSQQLYKHLHLIQNAGATLVVLGLVIGHWTGFDRMHGHHLHLEITQAPAPEPSLAPEPAPGPAPQPSFTACLKFFNSY